MRHLLILVGCCGFVALGPLARAQNQHGPYADKPGWHCYKGETNEKQKLAHCACKLHCDNDGNAVEANDCATYCATPSPCLCHSDEYCEGSR